MNFFFNNRAYLFFFPFITFLLLIQTIVIASELNTKTISKENFPINARISGAITVTNEKDTNKAESNTPIPINQKEDQKQKNSEELYKNAVQTLSQELSRQTKSIELCIYILTIVVGVFAITGLAIQIVSEWRRGRSLDEWKQNFDDRAETIGWKNKLNDAIQNIESEVESLKQTIHIQIEKFTHEAKEEALNQVSAYEKALLTRLEITREPLEKRLLVEQQVRFDLWNKTGKKLLNSEQNIETFISCLHLYHKTQLAIAELLSNEGEDLFNGVSKLIDIAQEDVLPDNLVLLLNVLIDQKRIPLNVMPNLERLKNLLNREYHGI